MPPSSEIPLSMRAVIIAYRFDLHLEYQAIAERLSVNHEAIKSLCQRVKKRCEANEQRSNWTVLSILLLYIKNDSGRGRKRRSEPGDQLSIAVRRGLEEWSEEERPVAANQGIKKRQVLGQLDPNIRPLDRKQVVAIAEDPEHCKADPVQPKPLTRKRKLDKPELNDTDNETRLEYCDYVDGLYKRRAVLICCDEKAYSFGGSEKGTHVTKPRGETAYTLRGKTRFKIEQWAAGCAEDMSITRPHVCWDIKTQNLPELQDKLTTVNDKLREEVNTRRLNCHIEGSPEWHEWRRRNNELRALNTKNSMDGIKEVHKMLTPATLYLIETFKLTGKKGGLNFVWYAFEVLQKELFPYYEAIRANNKDREVVIIEDNDPSHIKARKLLAAEINQKKITFAPHPANSPDFNAIETIQKYHKKSLEDYSTNITSAAKRVKDDAKAQLKLTWQSKDMDKEWKNRASNYALKLIADRCRKDKGGNHFIDDINISKL